MEEIPTIISTKDLSYISDIFNWNFNAAKVANFFSEEVKCEELKNFFEETYETHKNICQELIDLLSIGGENE